MHFFALLGLLSLAEASPLKNAAIRNGHSLSSRSIAKSDHVSSLTRVANSKKANARLLYGQAPLIFGGGGADFLTSICFGTQTFDVIIDTGSSDTWLVSSGFTCVNQTTNATLTEAECLFGPPYKIDTSFTQIRDENFNITYADGDYLNGIVGYDSVTLAGITVSHQEVGVVTLAAWDGDGVSSGLVGLAFPTLTSAYPGTNVSADNQTTNRIKYPSIIDTIFEIENLAEHVFSLALSRDESNVSYGGEIAIGGILDVSDPKINASCTFASAPFEILTHQFIDPNTPEIQFYVINVTNVAFGSELPLPNAQFIVDSGTSLIYIPTPAAIAYNSLFDPPAYNYNETGVFFVNCTAVPPPFAVEIAEEAFIINPLDLVLNVGEPGLCVSGIQDAGDLPASPSILGDVFLRNVLAVFDWGSNEMHFSAREYYSS